MIFRLSLLLVILSVSFAFAQKAPEAALHTLAPLEGFQVELFAAEPMVINPTSMDIDPQGRVWVTEAVNYRRFLRNQPLLREEGDRIQVLVDKTGDGQADEAITFYQGQDLIAPLGIAVAVEKKGGGLRVYVCQSPDILVFEDRDGDLKADGPPRKLLSGFGGFDHDHGVHGIVFGPDGKLYFTVGDAGVKNLQAADKKGPIWTTNDTTCQKGTVWRCNTDGTQLELIAHNFRNNYEACVDSSGEIWLSDNDDDGNQQTRICFVMPGGNYGYGPRGRGQSHWHEEQPGVVHKVLRTGFGSPTGIAFYEGTLLGSRYTGALLHCDAGTRELRAFFRKPRGAGYELDKEILLTSSDNWFRPSDVCVAPDGSVFVADWYDPGVGGHGMGDWTRGRIYRLTPQGHKGYAIPPIDLTAHDGVIKAVASPNIATRQLALTVLNTLQTPWHENQAVELIADARTSPILRARLMWSLARFRQVNRLAPYLNPKRWPPEMQMLALRILRDAFHLDSDRLCVYSGQVLQSPSAAVHREAALSLAQSEVTDSSRHFFYELAKKYRGSDHFFLAALNIACGTDPARRAAWLEEFPRQFPEWNEVVADLVWELRPKSMMPRMQELLADGTLSASQKARIVDILATNDGPDAGVVLLKLLTSDAQGQIKDRALANLRAHLPVKWSSLAGSEVLRTSISQLLGSPQTQLLGLQLVAASGDQSAVKDVRRILQERSHPLGLRLEAVRALGQVPGPVAVAALRECLADPALAAEAVRALAAHVGIAPKLNAPGQTALTYIQEVLLASDTSPELKALATDALAGTRVGSDWLLDLHQEQKLPSEVVPLAGKLLRNSPFQGQRNRALILFPASLKLDPKKLSPAELARRPAGDVDKGRKIMQASLTGQAQCLKCHMVRGVGGQVGPDLSMIGKKASRENLFESILQPSKAIADQYLQHRLVVDGVPLVGLIIEESAQRIVLRDANGKDSLINPNDVEGRSVVKVSIMPDDIAASLTEEELIDLVAYLQTLQTAAWTPDAWAVAGPFPSPGGHPDLDKIFRDESQPIRSERTLRAHANGYFDLAAFHGSQAEMSVSYVYAEVESPVDQEVEILLGTADEARLLVNGQMVFETKTEQAAAPARHGVKTRLRSGRNAVLLKIANGKNPHGFYFTLLSEQEVKGVKAER